MTGATRFILATISSEILFSVSRVKNILTSFAATIAINLVTLVGGILTARYLLPAGKGELTAVMLWPSLLAYAGNLGLADAMAFYSADAAHDTRKVVASGLAIALWLSVMLVSIGYIILPLVLGRQSGEALETTRLYLAYIPLNLVSLSLGCVLLGSLRLAEYNLVRTLVHVINVAGIVSICIVGQVSVRSFAWASLVANLGTLLVALGFVIRNRWLSWRPDPQIARGLLGYGLKAHLGSIASLANVRLDQAIISILLPFGELGLYAVAVSLSGAVCLAANTLAIVTFPHIANLSTVPEKKNALGRFVRLALVLSALAAIAALALTPWILHLFFGVKFLPATGVARVLILAAIPLGFNTVLTAGVKAMGHPLVSSLSEVIGLCVTGIALWLLLPVYGIMGAAWASLLAYCFVGALMLVMMGRQFEMKLAELFRPTSDDLRYVAHRFSALFA